MKLVEKFTELSNKKTSETAISEDRNSTKNITNKLIVS